MKCKITEEKTRKNSKSGKKIKKKRNNTTDRKDEITNASEREEGLVLI